MANSLTATSMPCTMPGVVRAANLTLPWAGETSLTCPPGLKTKASSHKAFIFFIFFKCILLFLILGCTSQLAGS